MKNKSKINVDGRLRGGNVLRRYLDVPRLINVLKTSSLYLCRSDLFPDKFEGSFTPSLRGSISASYQKNKIEYSYDKFKKELREGVFLNCWSLGVNDNMALWQLFGKTDDCVAITTTVAKLKTALNGFAGSGKLSIRKVDYIRHWKDPEIEANPYSNIFRYKTVGYEFEQEVRVILDRFESTFESTSKDEGVFIPIDLGAFFRSIVVSPECSPWFKDVVKDLLKKYGVSCPVRNSSMAKNPI
jgi:hypothetical protein